MSNRFGYTSVSIKPDDLAELKSFQVVLAARLGRSVNLTETLKIAAHIATTNLDEEFPPEG